MKSSPLASQRVPALQDFESVSGRHDGSGAKGQQKHSLSGNGLVVVTQLGARRQFFWAHDGARGSGHCRLWRREDLALAGAGEEREAAGW